MNAVEHCLLRGLGVSGPDAPALLSAGESLSYGALTARVARFAAALRAEGLEPRDRVAMQMRDTPDLIALHLAVMAAGGVAAPVSSRAAGEELRQILATIAPRLMVVDREFAERAPSGLKAAAPGARLLFSDRELEAWKFRPEAGIEPFPRADGDPALWLMTSGTTGQPRAVEHPHASVRVCSQYFEEVLAAGPSDRLFGTSRFHFAYALASLLAALRLGAAAVLLEHWATADSVAATVARFQPTIVLAVPALYHKLIDAGLASQPAFRAVHHYVSAGERLPPQLWAAWEAASGHPILDGLGCSEVIYIVIANTPHARRPGSSGRPLRDVEARLIAPDGSLITQAGVPGALEIRVASVCSGYRSSAARPGDPPERPDDRFKAGGWLATGDEYMRDADGFYHHRGRTGDMLRVSSMWVSPAEIEDALAGVPSIAQSAAVLGENAIGLQEIVLFVVPVGEDGEAALSDAREHLKRVLPDHKRPRQFRLIAELPRTATGKVQRHKLRAALADG
ncbi:MAG TPA: AMP-binding protein [Xanthobacteraceae bacterium]|jgi:benzoate-CoA ligase|nr:AMP-binding protein [Xanthobacteraceae bacterium]